MDTLNLKMKKFFLQNYTSFWVVVVHSFNPRTQEPEAGRSLKSVAAYSFQKVPLSARGMKRNLVSKNKQRNKIRSIHLFYFDIHECRGWRIALWSLFSPSVCELKVIRPV